MKRCLIPPVAMLVLLTASAIPVSARTNPEGPFVLDGVVFESQKAFIESGGRCATVLRGRPAPAPPADQIRQWLSERGLAQGGVIAVAFHVIYARTEEGNVPESQLDAQIQALNYSFSGRDYSGDPVPGAANTGYTFYKASVDRTRNNAWFHMNPGSGPERAAKSALVKTPETTLNIYTCKPGQLLLGWATFPWSLSSNPTMDGVVIHYGSLPGGYLAPYDLGGTAIHEVGHWVGLFHTFQGGCGDESFPGCATSGDGICDTPGEASAAFGCPIGRDTCPGAGLDPIHNYMDYTDDACYDNFTEGQDARVDFMMATYRPAIGSARVAASAGGFAAARRSADFALTARPNPLNPRTRIEFTTGREGRVSLRIYDVRGRLAATVVERVLAAGRHAFDFEAEALGSGIYLMALKADGREAVRRVSVLK